MGLRGKAMATLVIRSSEHTGAAATNGKKRSCAFSKLNTPSTPRRSSSWARCAAPTTELDSITSTLSVTPANLLPAPVAHRGRPADRYLYAYMHFAYAAGVDTPASDEPVGI